MKIMGFSSGMFTTYQLGLSDLAHPPNPPDFSREGLWRERSFPGPARPRELFPGLERGRRLVEGDVRGC